MKIEYKETSSLAVYANNARSHSQEQVARIMGSMIEFGWTFPILADEKGIVAGHGRLMAAIRIYESGKTIKLPNGEVIPSGKVPVIDCTGWSEAKRRAYIIADNKLPEVTGSWDEELLKIELGELQAEGFDVGLTGFSADELAELMAAGTAEGNTDPDDAPEPTGTPTTVPGDIWVLGAHRVMCGDSTSADQIEKLVAGKKVDLWITDPPYNVAYEGKTKDALTIQNDSMEDGKFREFLRGAYQAADANMREGAVFYIWHADSEGFNFRGAAHDIGWKVRQCLVWAKSVMVMGRQDYQWKHEPCLYGWKEGAAHYWASDRKQTTVLEFNKPKRNGEHPTMKPVELFAYQIGNSSRPGHLVLDSFGGSGTTAIACEQLGRQARLMELDPCYVDVIVERWQNFTGKEAVNETTGKTYNATKAKMLGEHPESVKTVPVE